MPYPEGGGHMLYVKSQLTHNVEIKVNIYGDDIFTSCVQCGAEIQVDEQHLVELLRLGDLASTAVKCTACSEQS
jgi:hypothetical protein